MSNLRESLETNALLLKSKVSRQAYMGLMISLMAILVSTILVAVQMTGELSTDSLLQAQRENMAIWILDTTPFAFAFWGQHINSVLSYQASAMVVDQTHELRMKAQALQTRNEYHMTHDSITDLPNRQLLMVKLRELVASENKLALILLNLSGYREVSRSLGHHNAEGLLKQFSARLVDCMAGPCVIGHVSEKEFAVVVTNFSDMSDVMSRAQALKNQLKLPFIFDSANIDLPLAIGISLYPEHGSEAEPLLKHASIAMHASKMQFNDILIYSSDCDNTSPKNLLLMGELRDALKNHDIVMHYQPKMALKSEKLIGCEALIRWFHPNLKWVSPEEFIPLAERSGLIRHLTFFVIESVVKQASLWMSDHPHYCVSLNLSAINLFDVDLVNYVKKNIDKYQLPPECLCLELTESSLLSDKNRAINTLKQLKTIGVKLSIDDFGTGYSSLSYLTTLPIDEVKIDKSFIMTMLDDEQHMNIVKAIINLGHALDKTIVAEGVSSKEILASLIELGCDAGQGYYFSKAQPAEEFPHHTE